MTIVLVGTVAVSAVTIVVGPGVTAGRVVSRGVMTVPAADSVRMTVPVAVPREDGVPVAASAEMTALVATGRRWRRPRTGFRWDDRAGGAAPRGWFPAS